MSQLQVVAFDDRTQKHPSDSNLPDWLPKHEFLMLIVAPAGAGKTTLLLNILLRIYKQYWHDMYIFSPTIHNDAKWQYLKETPDLLLPPINIQKKELKSAIKIDNNSDDDDKPCQHNLKKEPEDDNEKWKASEEYDFISNLKDNEILDPFDKKIRTSKAKRTTLSKYWYDKTQDKNMYYGSMSSLLDRNTAPQPRSKSKEALLKEHQNIDRLSSVIISPPTPIKQRYTRDLYHNMYNEQPMFYKCSNPNNISRIPKSPQKHIKPKTKPTKQHTQHKKNVTFQQIDEDNLKEEYSEESLNEIMDKIDEKVRNQRESVSPEQLAIHMERLVWVFDDMVGSGLFNNRRNNAFKRLTVRRRHYFSSLIGVTQAYKEIPKTTRTNANALILFKIDSDEELAVIYREYPMGLKYNHWLKVVQFCTEQPYHFVMFNLQTSNPDHKIIHNFDRPLSQNDIQYIINM